MLSQVPSLKEWFHLEKVFYDYSDDVEGVNIHYLWSPLGEYPDWQKLRVTRFMPRALRAGRWFAPEPVRKKVLRLPLHIFDPAQGKTTTRYLFYHYFEIFEGGHRKFSPLFMEKVDTEEGTCIPYDVEAQGAPSVERSENARGREEANA